VAQFQARQKEDKKRERETDNYHATEMDREECSSANCQLLQSGQGILISHFLSIFSKKFVRKLILFLVIIPIACHHFTLFMVKLEFTFSHS
jgi:hypothetical protein